MVTGYDRLSFLSKIAHNIFEKPKKPHQAPHNTPRLIPCASVNFERHQSLQFSEFKLSKNISTSACFWHVFSSRNSPFVCSYGYAQMAKRCFGAKNHLQQRNLESLSPDQFVRHYKWQKLILFKSQPKNDKTKTKSHRNVLIYVLSVNENLMKWPSRCEKQRNANFIKLVRGMRL